MPVATELDIKLEYSVVPDKPAAGKTQAIVVAGGSSRRMGGVNKLFAPLLGIPVLARSLAALEHCACIEGIVVAAREQDIPDVQRLCGEYRIAKLRAVVPGGETRTQSAACGLAACDADADYIAVHDAARPLVRPETIERVCEAARRFEAAACAVRVKDTVKRTDENGVVLETPERSRLWQVQTPQVFAAALYRRAVEAALRDQADCTDDCALCERLGARVQLVEGDYTNLKITTPEDLAVAQALLLYQSEGGAQN